MIKTNRLVAFGASITFGQALPDCDYDNHPTPQTLKPSKYAWPALLGSRLNLETVNLAGIGYSNHSILLSILNADISETDIAIIYWNVSIVNTIYKENSSILNIRGINEAPNKDTMEDVHDLFYKVHTDYDILISSLMNILHAKHYLDSLGIKSYHFWDDWFYRKCLVKNRLLSVFKKHPCPCHTLGFRFDHGSDNRHPGPRAHRDMADRMYNIIQGNNEQTN